MRMLITAGPTREFFDTVRFISNPSSGKMGYAIADCAARRGHTVVLVSGPVSLTPAPGVNVVHVESAEEMCVAATSAFERCDAAVMTAAVCDYRPTRRIDHKLKKQHRVRPIQLQPTTDICALLGQSKGDRVVIGFAMEDHDEHAHAEAKLHRKRCDAIVLNGIDNVGGDSARIEIFRAHTGWSRPFRGTKSRIAEKIVQLSEQIAKKRDR